MEGSDPNWCCHRLWLRITTASRPGTRSSSGRNVRPNSGSTPITLKKLPLTSRPSVSFGSASGVAARPDVTSVKATNPLKLVLRSRTSRYSRYEAPRRLNPSTDILDPTVTTSPARATVSGRSSSASAQLNAAQFAPMPIASEPTATTVKPGLAASVRQPYRTSCHNRSSHPNPQTPALSVFMVPWFDDWRIGKFGGGSRIRPMPSPAGMSDFTERTHGPWPSRLANSVVTIGPRLAPQVRETLGSRDVSLKAAVLRQIVSEWPSEAVHGLSDQLLLIATDGQSWGADLLALRLLAEHRLGDPEWIAGWLEFKREYHQGRLSDIAEVLRMLRDTGTA